MICWNGRNLVRKSTRKQKLMIFRHRIYNIYSSWSDGFAICALLNHLYPSSLDYDNSKLSTMDSTGRISFGLSLCKQLGIVSFLDAEEISRGLQENDDYMIALLMNIREHAAHANNLKSSNVLKWINFKLPNSNISGMKDLNNGVNLIQLLENLSAKKLVASDPQSRENVLQNMREILSVSAKLGLDISKFTPEGKILFKVRPSR